MKKKERKVPTKQVLKTLHQIEHKFKGLRIPDVLVNESAAHLADLWEGSKEYMVGLEEFLRLKKISCEEAGEILTEVQTNLEHIEWHIKEVKRPLNKILTKLYAQN